jgi:uncharacterized membrane protein YcaP (DUF421 family)
MSWVKEMFGEGEDLTPMQMGVRAAVMFVICLVLIRLAGRRAFGMRMPFDNVISVLLGAVLSRGIIGASPFWSTVAAAAVIVALHRLFAWVALYSDAFGRLIKSDSDVLYKDGRLDRKKMNKALISEKDLREGVRVSANIDDLEEADKIYVERDGKISVVKKK